MSKEGMHSMASCICKKSKLFLFGFFAVIDHMAMFHQAVMTLEQFSWYTGQCSQLDWFDCELQQV